MVGDQVTYRNTYPEPATKFAIDRRQVLPTLQNQAPCVRRSKKRGQKSNVGIEKTDRTATYTSESKKQQTKLDECGKRRGVVKTKEVMERLRVMWSVERVWGVGVELSLDLDELSFLRNSPRSQVLQHFQPINTTPTPMPTPINIRLFDSHLIMALTLQSLAMILTSDAAGQDGLYASSAKHHQPRYSATWQSCDQVSPISISLSSPFLILLFLLSRP